MSTKPISKPLPDLDQPVMRRKPSPLWWILVTLFVVSLVILGWVLYARRPQSPHHVTDGANTVKVLFIGNSYTDVNNLPGLLMELAAHEATPIDVELVTVGGARLTDHWAQGAALAAIQRVHWDYVVLQEQSTLGYSEVKNGIDQIGDPAAFHQAVRLFNTEIQKNGAKTLLYLTWARQNAPQNQALLTKAYMDIARELKLPVVPVGLAWQQTLRIYPSTPLYQDDGSHPTPIGTYLAACVFYAAIYHKSPEGLSPHVSSTLVNNYGNIISGDANLNPNDAHALQQIAWQTVENQ